MIPVSVVLTTYDSPDWLEKVLWGYAAQVYKNFEIVIADDGSSPVTEGLIDEMRRQTRLAIRHVWHEKQGFRKCRILNRAIVETSNPYLIFSDGDCIPRSDFVEVHAKSARRGCFLSGGMVRLNHAMSRRLVRTDIMSGRIFDPQELIRQGHGWDRKLRMLVRDQVWIWLFEKVSTTRPTFNGHHSSVWRDDVLAVNGFDERMQYGGLDRELGERLTNRGVYGRSVRHRTVCLHLEHDRNYINEDGIHRNWLIRVQTRREQRSWTDFGILTKAENQASEICVGSSVS
jgi:glycosyltransferase involved in cell wall biosynthesis